MKRRRTPLFFGGMAMRMLKISVLLAAFACLPAAAQPGSGMGGMGGMQGGGMGGMGGMRGGGPGMAAQGAIDCSRAADPARCEARQKARNTCQDQRGPARRQCMDDQMPPRDCSKARNPQRCEAMEAAHQACKGKVGPERRQCMRDQAPAARGVPPKKP